MKTNVNPFFHQLARICAAALVAGAPLLAYAEASKEYAVKAGCLGNFPRFIEWPTAAFASDAAPLRIGILGDDPFDGALKTITEEQKVQGRSIVIARAQTPAELKDCHLVFVSRGGKFKPEELAAAFAGTSTVTVGESPGFAARGGIINFYLRGANVAFEINLDAARAKGLKISAQMLSLARIVSSKPEDKP